MNLIYTTGYSSLFIQIVTAILDLYVLVISPIAHSITFLKELLWLEFIVQIIEGTFYVWMVTCFQHIHNITPYRYRDWFLSTPVMLFSLCSYLLYIQSANPLQMRIVDVVQTEWPLFLLIGGLNATMLFFGYWGEKRQLPQTTATLLGFVPFFAMFGLIWNYYVSSMFSKWLVGFFIFFWGLYGLASLQDYTTKNVYYNVLDLFSKNIINVLLAVCLLYQYVPGAETKET